MAETGPGLGFRASLSNSPQPLPGGATQGGLPPLASLASRHVGELFTDLDVIGSFYLVGIDYQVKMVRVDDSYVALQLWDTAGQER